MTGLPRSYGLVRPCAAHRYARLVVVATWTSPLASERQGPAVPHESPDQTRASSGISPPDTWVRGGCDRRRACNSVSHTDSGRRTRRGFLCGREAGRLVHHESRRQAMARVAGHLSVEDLEAGFRSARDPTATRHVQVIWLLARGHTIADVAAVTSFVPR